MNRSQTNFFKEEDIYNKAWELILKRIEFTATHLQQIYFPMLADNITGEWESFENPNWTGGFWTGMLWLAYEHTKKAKYLQYARTWNDAILGFEQENNHDRGFIYYYSSVYGYKLTSEKRYLESAFQAARKLVNMFRSNSKVIPQNLNDKQNVIIDTMVNLQLLWWAHANAEDSDPFRQLYKQVAILHTQQTLNNFIRSDGSTWQSVHFDTTTGNIIKKHTHQGYADSTCWSRGQSWGCYGFLKAYEATRDINFLNVAITLADYIITHLPDDGVPWYDYDDPSKKKDTSAGAIAASAFIQLSKIVTDSVAQTKYFNTGKHIIENLIQSHLTPFVGTESPPGILRNGCYQIFKNSDSETIWGDYYFMEALAFIHFN
jgi:unsaturated chondroitin disaccharide hydrolase